MKEKQLKQLENFAENLAKLPNEMQRAILYYGQGMMTASKIMEAKAAEQLSEQTA